MKTLFFLFALLVSSLVSHAQTTELNYVITESDTIYCSRVQIGLTKTKVTLLSGEKIKIANNEITGYAYSGKFMRKLPVYLNKKQTDCCALMELVANKNGLSIFKHEYFNGVNESYDAIFNFYRGTDCIYSQRNPSLKDIQNFIAEYSNSSEEWITLE